MTTPTQRNCKLVLRYDGSRFFGWQRHGTKPTVQGAVEASLSAICGEPITIAGSGRTDRGAHAEGQVATASLPASVTISDELTRRLNETLPEGIEVTSVEEAPADFHARTSATGKQYRYVVWTGGPCPADQKPRVWTISGTLDVAAMQSAAPHFLGQHDFASFATRPNFQQKNTVRDLRRLDISEREGVVEFILEADGFLYKMVRNIVRCLVRVGEGRTAAAEIPRILAAKDRKAAPGTAPASGLILYEVFYEPV
ncbi:tRNA pseudouridine synthase A [Enhygromyxa salina]|uniref:tRNA pseudouridine synthase A n=1 Tax=Enhygromyxa salina TaxID=215803 RepID=A0A2S9Y7F6_9BACT|nr:tRNA pseudouridine(38-40) synthase TruA [Enhygromyxa salina]PRQ01025.1 tRNA pseudouridine synthase A [Enhygromyxa salina]